ncbi:hypothetical protein N0V83_004991 [Neocucurbitaria cava]|uniref:Uncharacterized protein n=1 Tax=Neocucurbitaria cava TaxID=798079 RepID=A0A9W8Y8Y2_9PLEO|nr:hypothetical protein N0V83_004991 [Neocucurbitaria cava]
MIVNRRLSDAQVLEFYPVTPPGLEKDKAMLHPGAYLPPTGTYFNYGSPECVFPDGIGKIRCRSCFKLLEDHTQPMSKQVGFACPAPAPDFTKKCWELIGQSPQESRPGAYKYNFAPGEAARQENLLHQKPKKVQHRRQQAQHRAQGSQQQARGQPYTNQSYKQYPLPSASPYQMPSLGYQTPRTAYQEPPSAYQSPQTEYKMPPSAYQTSQPAYQTPPSAYRAPQTEYKMPPWVCQTSQPAYQTPPSAYRAPQAVYKMPTSAYQAPPAPGSAYQPMHQPPSASQTPYQKSPTDLVDNGGGSTPRTHFAPAIQPHGELLAQTSQANTSPNMWRVPQQEPHQNQEQLRVVALQTQPKPPEINQPQPSEYPMAPHEQIQPAEFVRLEDYKSHIEAADEFYSRLVDSFRASSPKKGGEDGRGASSSTGG